MSADWAQANLIFRQVHPNHWDGKNPNSVAFSPTPKDDKKLSVDNSELVTAERSWNHFTKNLGFQSVGTWAVNVSEIHTQADLDLQSAPIVDKDDATKNNPAHCLIDFSSVTSKGQIKRRAQYLAIRASERGCQFLAST